MIGKLLSDIGSETLFTAALNAPNRLIARQIRADEEARQEKKKQKMLQQQKQAGIGGAALGSLKWLGGGGKAALRAATVATGAGLLEAGIGNKIEDVYDSWRKPKRKKEEPPDGGEKKAGLMGDTMGALGVDMVGQALANGLLSRVSRAWPATFGNKDEREAARAEAKKPQPTEKEPMKKQANDFFITANGISSTSDPIVDDFLGHFHTALKRDKLRYQAKTAELSKEARQQRIQTLLNTSWLAKTARWRDSWRQYVKQAMEAAALSVRSKYIKLAADSMGNATEVEFETAMAQLSMLYLKDKAPKLFDYFVGFRVLDKSDDNTRAVGIFGFKIGSEWIYVPVFFLNGELKGHELMYLYNKNQFRPLKENWINTVIRKKPATIGTHDMLDVGSLGVRYPDMRQLTQPPPLGKIAAAGGLPPAKINSKEDAEAFAAAGKKLEELQQRQRQLKKAAEVLPSILDMPEWVQLGVMGLAKAAAVDYGDPYYKQSDHLFDLERVCGNDFRIFRKLAYACELYPTLKLGMDQFYGRDFFQRTWSKLNRPEKTYCQPLKFAREHSLADILTQDTKTPAVSNKKKRNVSVLIDVKNDDISKHLLNQSQIVRIIDGLPVAIDHRNHDEVAVVHGGLRFISPDKTGVYNVFMANGQVRECLVIIDPIGEQKNLERCLVVDWKRKECIRAKCRSVLCLDEPFNEDWFDRLPADQFKTPTSMHDSTRERDRFHREDDSARWLGFRKRVFVGLDGRGTLPLTSNICSSEQNTNNGVWGLENNPDDAEGDVDFSGDAAYKPYLSIVTERMLHTVMGNDMQRLQPVTRGGPLPSQLIARKELGGNTFIIRDDKLYLPKVFKYIDLSYGRSTIALATENDIKNLLFGRVKTLQGHKTASENKYILDHSQPLTYNKAFERLVLDYDFREKTAEEILTTLDLLPNRTVDISYRLPKVKTADMFSNTPQPPQDLTQGRNNVLAPTFQDPQIATDPYSGVTTQMPFQDIQQLGYEGTSTPISQTTDAPPPPDPMAMQAAQTAVQNKQKDVFDVSTLTGLLQNDRNDDTIRDYAKIFKQALDKFGRLLFKFYWDKDFFSERFGEDKLQAFEDSLKDSLDKVGDLCLFIEEKDDRPAISDLLGAATLDESPEEAS